jgi:radical SAM protein with 4Fe4S-binding SPASM domain
LILIVFGERLSPFVMMWRIGGGWCEDISPPPNSDWLGLLKPQTIPVVEHNGDFYSCDHYVDGGYRLGNITETSLIGLLESLERRAFGEAKLGALPRYGLGCEVRDICNGECPKNRFTKFRPLFVKGVLDLVYRVIFS